MKRPLLFVLPLIVGMILLNAPAMLREAENLPFDAPARAAAMRVLPALARSSSLLWLDRPRRFAEFLEKHLSGC